MFTVNIETGNAAFQDEETGAADGYELARILRDLADRIEPAYLTPSALRPACSSRTVLDGVLRDSNGNAVGHWRWSA